MEQNQVFFKESYYLFAESFVRGIKQGVANQTGSSFEGEKWCFSSPGSISGRGIAVSPVLQQQVSHLHVTITAGFMQRSPASIVLYIDRDIIHRQ